MSERIPAIVLGGTGYVAGELVRLLLGHPVFELAAVVSDSQPGEALAVAFAHLASVCGEQRFASAAQLERHLAQGGPCAIFSAAPHGVSAGLIDRVLQQCTEHGTAARVVDISADFRYPAAQSYTAVYRHPHGAPARIAEFTCAVPEHLPELGTRHVAHPGCFATAALLAGVPLLSLGLCAPLLFVAGITGSTGSGRKPTDGTHHPLRHGDLYSYQPLAHRHVPEIEACALRATGVAAQFAFVPHSGPFARGIHVTVQAKLNSPLQTPAVLQALRTFYAGAPFIRISAQPPHVKHVAASNYAHLSATADGRTVAVTCAIDNLTKGAAGGAVQWMNRLFGIAETSGLTAPAPGWT